MRPWGLGLGARGSGRKHRASSVSLYCPESYRARNQECQWCFAQEPQASPARTRAPSPESDRKEIPWDRALASLPRLPHPIQPLPVATHRATDDLETTRSRSACRAASAVLRSSSGRPATARSSPAVRGDAWRQARRLRWGMSSLTSGLRRNGQPRAANFGEQRSHFVEQLN